VGRPTRPTLIKRLAGAAGPTARTCRANSATCGTSHGRRHDVVSRLRPDRPIWAGLLRPDDVVCLTGGRCLAVGAMNLIQTCYVYGRACWSK